MSITLEAVPSDAGVQDRCDYALRLSTDYSYERYTGILQNEAGNSIVSLSEEEACFLYWLADLKSITAAMLHRIFKDMPVPATAVGRLERRLSSAGIDADSIFRRHGGDYHLAAAAERCETGADVDADLFKSHWTVAMVKAQAARQAA